MYNSNTESLGLILGVEVFFFSGSLFRSTVAPLRFVTENFQLASLNVFIKLLQIF